MSDELEFLIEDEPEEKSLAVNCWKVLIVDDEEQVHQITKLTLKNFNFQNKSLEFTSAYSAIEAKKILEEENDFAVALVDVVMETDDAGLELVKYIRNDIKNEIIRIVLRTGQPGQAPESEVVREFDINDFKSKTV